MYCDYIDTSKIFPQFSTLLIFEKQIEIKSIVTIKFSDKNNNYGSFESQL